MPQKNNDYERFLVGWVPQKNNDYERFFGRVDAAKKIMIIYIIFGRVGKNNDDERFFCREGAAKK